MHMLASGIGISMKNFVISVDSRDRNYEIYSKPNGYVIDLPDIYKNVTTATLLNCQIPSSFYIFASYLNNTTLKVGLTNPDLPNVTHNATITIPDGNYNQLSMKLTLETLLDDAFAGQFVKFTVNLNSVNMKLRITINDPKYIISIDTTGASPLQKTNWGLGYYLGFEPNVVISGELIDSPSVVSLNPYTYMFLEIEGLNTIDECGEYQRTRAAFAKIPISSNSFEYTFLDKEGTSFGKVVLNPSIAKFDKLRVSWRFHDGKLIEFNNVEHSFSIELLTNDVLAI